MMNRPRNRLTAFEALDRIINDSDSGSEFELSDDVSKCFVYIFMSNYERKGS